MYSKPEKPNSCFLAKSEQIVQPMCTYKTLKLTLYFSLRYVPAGRRFYSWWRHRNFSL